MNITRRVMLLIDADNVSAAVIEEAVRRTISEYPEFFALSPRERPSKVQYLF